MPATKHSQAPIDAITTYIAELNRQYSTPKPTEHSYRPALANLLLALLPHLNPSNEQGRTECGAPDFVLLRLKDNIPIAYIEAKDIGDPDLEGVKGNKEQFGRYKAALDNIIFTDHLNFVFCKSKEIVDSARVAEAKNQKIIPVKDQFEKFLRLLAVFGDSSPQTITSPDRLSHIMADKARLMAKVFEDSLAMENGDSALAGQMEAFKSHLIHDITPKEFADIYAQTIAYGMFAARIHDTSSETFNRESAAKLIPKTNPFLRNLFHTIAGFDLDKNIAWIVDDLTEAFRATDIQSVMKGFSQYTQQTDPIIHFYENFLTAYDPKLRKSRGVYYTPQPVVSFIVRAVDEILQKDFGLQRGLTDTSMLDIRVGGQGKAKAHKVQILDPALGTGTFLAETVRQVYEKFKDQKGQWQSYVEQHLVPRLNGFEILMAPYAMAHLKLDWLLTETGYKPDNSERLRIFLTNSLEDIDTVPGPLFAQFLANESREALSVKRETPVMVVMGNPPYSGISSNTGEWITRLLGDYKKEPASNSPLNERKHWLNDDYVKFIRLGQFYIDRNREGILAFINNHSFLDNPTFRGMRWHLMSSFDKIYVINLHGNAKKMEVAPGGGKDENVFDIQQGVSINFFVKTKHKKKGDLAEVSYLDLYGSRQFKYDYLLKNGFQSLAFDRVKPTTPFFFMVPKDESNRDEYEQGFSVNKLMQINTSGIVSMGDSFAFADTKDELDNRLRRLLDPKYTIEQLNEEFSLGKNYADFVVNAKSALKLSDNSFIEVSYRPFETKWTYFDNRILWRPRTSVMRHFVDGQNIGLLTCRQSAIDSWEHVGITRNVIDDCRISNRTKERGYVFPLYLHPALDNLSSPTPTPNLNMGIVTKIAEGLGMKFDPKAGLFKKGDKNSFTPIDLLDYMYAVLHSPSYRAKYKEFLKIDFPRVPFPSDATEFRRLVTLGTELRLLHLMEHPALEKPIVGYPIGGSDTVEKLRWEAGSGSKGRVWINDAQCIDKVPLVAWEFCVGGYQPAQKWLKDRKGRKLTYEDINHYQRIISVLKRTNEIMERIDD